MAIEYIIVQDATGVQRKVAADLFNTDQYAQLTKLAWGADGTVTLVETAAPLPTKQTHGKTILSGVISASVSGDNNLGSIVSGQSVKILGITFVCTGANVITFKDSGGTALTGAMSFGAQGGLSLGPSGDPTIYVMKPTTVGTGLVINLSAAQQVSGFYVYLQE